MTWNGATLKRSGSVYMLGAAGGHGDYAGNEVNALVLNTESPQWVELRGPSPNSEVINDPAQFLLDLRPAPTHTYYATVFIESQNRMIVMPSPGLGGSFPAAPSGWPWVNSGKRHFVYDVAAGDWVPPNRPGYPDPYPGVGNFTACIVAKHPVTEDVYYCRGSSDGWYRWRPTAPSGSQWTRLSNTTRSQWYACAVIDPLRNRMLTVGNFAADTAPIVRNLDGTTIGAGFGGLGAGALTLAGYPGAVYDEANDAYLLMQNSGGATRMLRINAATWFVDEPATTGMKPASRDNGIHNAFQYVPELRGVVIANKYSGNVMFMRTAA